MRTTEQKENGFTMVELLIVMTLTTILLTLAVPSFRDESLGSQLRACANELVAAAALARSEAIKRNTTVTMCASSDGATCAGAWEQGWLVALGATPLQRGSAAPTGFKIVESSGLTQLSFQAIGAGATAATFTVCRQTPSVGAQERIVSLDATGRASVQTTTRAACP